MTAHPTGTVTFLFTDIEGSTRLWEDHREAMRSALERHDALLRDTIATHGGYVFTTAGDAFSAAFSDPVSALGAAVAAQQRIGKEDWNDVGDLRVRMALHTGVAHERDGDYFGPALNRVARMLSAGHGGQILMSLGTEELVGSVDGFATKDLGQHTLKDLGRPEHIYQVVAPGLREDFPQLLSLDVHPHNLPVQLTTFVGRERELNDVVKRLHDHRLLTLTGVGGSGKTRLAIQAAAESIADHPHGVWLVELASVGDPDLIAQAIGDVLGLTKAQGGSGNSQLGGDPATVLDQVTNHPRTRTALLILDNCEHLITATARLVKHLLQACPDLTVLATSREGLGVPGEALWQVPSLGVHHDDPLTGDAVRLFAERAEDANPRFRLDVETLPWVQRICERLDGMPLAIELAASRARVLDARQIAERLDDRFRLLTGGSRTALPRHQTLEATVDWSYNLMSPEERVLFQRLAAFRGGFTLEAAEAVCTGGLVGEYDVLDLLGHLVDKSMVVRDEITGRFHMLETLRQYALRRLTESDEVDPVRVRHAEHFQRFSEATAPGLLDEREAEAYEAFAHDHDNIRAALAYCLEHDLGMTASRIATATSWFWWQSSDDVEASTWLEKVLPFHTELDPHTGASLLAFAGLFAAFRKDPAAEVHGTSAVARAREAGDAYAEGLGHMALGFSDWTASQYDTAQEHFAAMLECGVRAADDWLTGEAEILSVFSHRMMSRLDQAAERVKAAEAAFRRQRSKSGLAWVLASSGQIARYRGDFETEIAKQREARKLFADVGAKFSIAFTLVNEAIALTLLGRAGEAVEPSRRGIAIERELSLTDGGIEALVLGGWFESEAGNHAEALDLFDEAFRKCAPGLDPYTLSQAAEHLMITMSLLDRWEDAAVVDGYYESHQSRPEPDIYARHNRRHRDAYRRHLAGRVDGVLERGRSMTTQQVYDHARAAIADARFSLSPG